MINENLQELYFYIKGYIDGEISKNTDKDSFTVNIEEVAKASGFINNISVSEIGCIIEKIEEDLNNQVGIDVSSYGSSYITIYTYTVDTINVTDVYGVYDTFDMSKDGSGKAISFLMECETEKEYQNSPLLFVDVDIENKKILSVELDYTDGRGIEKYNLRADLFDKARNIIDEYILYNFKF